MRCGQPLAPLEQTVVGYAGPVPERRFQGTMLGIAPPSLQQPRPGQPGPAEPGGPAQPSPFPHRSSAPGGMVPTQPTGPAPLPGAGFRQTMIGMSPPNAAGQGPGHPAPAPQHQYPTPAPAAATPPASAQQPAGSAAGATLPYLAPAKKTVMGIARPGIAPMNPGQAKALPAAPVSNLAPSSHLPSSRRPVPSGSRGAHDEHGAKRGVPLVAALAIVGAGGLFAAALVVWLFYRGHGPIEAQATALADGSERLALTCAACENGSVVRLDAANATFASQRASLALSRPLKVGENPMTITLLSAHGKQSFVEISVPIAFRVRGDTSGLDATPPQLRVQVSALPGSSVTVDGKPVTLSADGEGTYAIDVSAEVTGFDPSVKPLERRLPYVVTPPHGASQTGIVSLQAGITPLVIEAPGPAVVVETSNFVLAGRTAKAGALTVGDRPITVDPTGRFAQMMNVSAPGETTITIRATSKDSAPRLFPLRVRRVDSLAREAERVRQRATGNYAAIADQTEGKRGWAVALDGSVVDARTENYSTVAVMDVQGGCAHSPCLARITYGAPFSLARGDKFSAFGEIIGVVDGPRTGTRIPEVRADFLLKGNK